MFQSFNVISSPDHAWRRLEKLRAEMTKVGVDGFLVPRADEHQGEYVPERAQRLGWLTGFTGSAGQALILQNQALLFVDGRYSLQVRQQTDERLFSYHDLIPDGVGRWLAQQGQEGNSGLKIGFDPWLHTIAEVARLRDALETSNGQLLALEQNLVDVIWEDQPAAPQAPISIQPLSLAGQTAEQKLKQMDDQMLAAGVDAALLTDPSSVAWLFNIRGQDVSNTPLPLSFALLRRQEKPLLFLDHRKLGQEETRYLADLCQIEPPASLELEIRNLARSGAKILLDERLTAEKFRLMIAAEKGATVFGADPARLPRAVKNEAELNGSRAAHKRDGVALVRFFSWMDRQTPGVLDEISLAQKLEQYRAQTALELGSKLEDLSFDTISGAGANGAIIHYRVNEATNRTLQAGELYLVDSGAQYRDGTTDVTRTVACGEVGQEEKRCFTLVLKGMIAISRARFPDQTRGVDLDGLARMALWQAGFDYAHGTGHGVGSYLSVHEGPQSLSRYGMEVLVPGMILSNEPGYYRNGQFGIRIENLLIVTPAEAIAGGDRAMLGFETLTLCPIDQRLILRDLLENHEREWLNAYHARIYAELAPYLDRQDKEWLMQATRAL